METITVKGGEIKVGDVMRFRMSKHDAVRWLAVTGLHETKSGRRVQVELEGGKCLDLVSKIETRQVRRGAGL